MDRGYEYTTGLKRVTHIGSDGSDGLIGYNQLRRADDPDKAETQKSYLIKFVDSLVISIVRRVFDAYFTNALPGRSFGFSCR